MIYRSRCPLRISFAGGGTELSPYVDMHGGLVLSSTINLFAYCTIQTSSDGHCSINAADSNQKQSFASLHEITYKVGKPFTKIVCACIELFNSELLRAGVKGINVTTHTDAPIGSGLGTSSTLTAAILACICDIVGRRPSA